MRICFHGTTKENADNILKSGFNVDTYFAKHLEDAIGFGGEYVFYVRFDENRFNFDIMKEDWWQFHTCEIIPPDWIWQLKSFSPETLLDNSSVVEDK